MPVQIFVAKMSGSCAICHQEVQGKRVAYNKQKQLCHADCIWPDKVKTAKPQQPKANPLLESVIAAGATTPVTAVGEYSISENAQRAVAKAKRILAERPELVEISQGLLVEIMREDFDIYMSERIQKYKLANMERIR